MLVALNPVPLLLSVRDAQLIWSGGCSSRHPTEGLGILREANKTVSRVDVCTPERAGVDDNVVVKHRTVDVEMRGNPSLTMNTLSCSNHFIVLDTASAVARLNFRSDRFENVRAPSDGGNPTCRS